MGNPYEASSKGHTVYTKDSKYLLLNWKICFVGDFLKNLLIENKP